MVAVAFPIMKAPIHLLFSITSETPRRSNSFRTAVRKLILHILIKNRDYSQPSAHAFSSSVDAFA